MNTIRSFVCLTTYVWAGKQHKYTCNVLVIANVQVFYSWQGLLGVNTCSSLWKKSELTALLGMNVFDEFMGWTATQQCYGTSENTEPGEPRWAVGSEEPPHQPGSLFVICWSKQRPNRMEKVALQGRYFEGTPLKGSFLQNNTENLNS